MNLNEAQKHPMSTDPCERCGYIAELKDGLCECCDEERQDWARLIESYTQDSFTGSYGK